MEVYRRSSGLLLLLGLFLLATTLQGVQGEVESEGPSESECRPYIEKALKELEAGEVVEAAVGTSAEVGDSKEDIPTVEITDDSDHQEGDGEKDDTNEDGQESKEYEIVSEKKIEPEVRQTFFQKVASFFQKIFRNNPSKKEEAANESKRSEHKQDDASPERGDQPSEGNTDSKEAEAEHNSKEEVSEEADSRDFETTAGAEEQAKDDDSKEDDKESEDTENKDDTGEQAGSVEQIKEEINTDTKDDDSEEETDQETGSNEHDGQDDDKSDERKESVEEATEAVEAEGLTQSQDQQDDDSKEDKQSIEADKESLEEQTQADEAKPESTHDDRKNDSEEDNSKADYQIYSQEDTKDDITKAAEDETKEETEDSKEDAVESKEAEDNKSDENGESKGDDKESEEETKDKSAGQIDVDQKDEDSKEEEQLSKEDDGKDDDEGIKEGKDDEDGKEDKDDEDSKEGKDDEDSKEVKGKSAENGDDSKEKRVGTDSSEKDEDEKSSEEGGPVEELSVDTEVPTELRPRDHVEQLLKLDDQSSETETLINRVSEITLRDLKKLYENAIKPLEVVYKYRDLSNRHFGDAEIFSKPLILFMGPWSGGKSTIINYLTNNEFNDTSLRTGAEPSPAYFNILMYGEEPEVIDGTELAADFTFSGLQKFGQGLEERLRGIKLPSKLLEKVNIVEIPGILEVRKQVSRVFPFNDACQWFIDRGDIIFLVYDPSKLDVGPETEAILDQLKGREHQTRIILNKADRVKPEELMRVQGALIWNISPLMSSPQPPIMYTTSLWSRPYEPWAPVRLLQAQERTFLRDLRGAIDKRIENKIASARRFAVRVRNHAKMVDCYLTTYYNHKSVFGNRKQVADAIIEHPQDYHIYEGLSTLTNISRYDLPDPDVYRDFFKLNPLYEFQQLSATCTYFRGCPINRLDIAIAYDLPELLGTHKKRIENALAEAASGPQPTTAPGS